MSLCISATALPGELPRRALAAIRGPGRRQHLELHAGPARQRLRSLHRHRCRYAFQLQLFQVNFRDERWLPFEGQGVVSTWNFTLDPRDNDFDLSTVTDVVMHFSYSCSR